MTGHFVGAQVRERRTTLVNVQGLRGIAALVVVMAHVSGQGGFESRVFGSTWTGWANLPANAGVDLFFVISGLIMVMTTWRTFDMPGSARLFLWRRVTRIYPLYWLINSAIILLFVVSPRSVNFHASPFDIVISYLLVPHDGRLPLLVAWSLVYEMYFYLVFALTMLMRRRRLGRVVGGWVVITLALDAIIGETSNPVLALVASALSLEFVFGVVIGYAVVHRRAPYPRLVLAFGLVAMAVDLVALGASGWTEFPSQIFRVCFTGIPAALVVYGAVGMELAEGHVVPRVLRVLGDCSYSLYLIHVPALTLLATLLAGRVPIGPAVHSVAFVAVFVYVIGGALLCHRLLERPFHEFFVRLLRSRQKPSNALETRSLAGETEPAR